MEIRARSEDDDDRAEAVQQSIENTTFRRRDSPLAEWIYTLIERHVENASGWFQVLIPWGSQYDKDFILQSLLRAVSPEEFIPHYWKAEGENVLFYVDDFKVAKALFNIDRTIDLPNGYKMIVKVRNVGPPV